MANMTSCLRNWEGIEREREGGRERGGKGVERGDMMNYTCTCTRAHTHTHTRTRTHAHTEGDLE